MANGERTPETAWNDLVEGLRSAGERMAELTADLDPVEQADGYRALLRAFNNQLGRFEVDRERPELVPFNGWREKMFMDNPDYRYWVADIASGRSYRIVGTVGDAVHVSVTAYRSDGSLDAAATARIDSDSLHVDEAGRFEVIVAPERPMSGADWLPLPEDASVIWVRQFHNDVQHDELGWCTIEPVDDPGPSAPLDPERFARQLRRLGRGFGGVPELVDVAGRHDREHPNEVRHWREMTGGAAFTEPNIHYVRGSWELGSGEALVLEGDVPRCRTWNVLLYSRFLNSLDARSRTVSATAGSSRGSNGRYRVVISDRDPGDGSDWLDTEGRSFGLFVFRFLQPVDEPALPTVRRCLISELEANR